METQDKPKPPSRPRQSLKEVMAQKRLNLKSKGPEDQSFVEDPYEAATKAKESIRKGTAYYYLPSEKHCNQWDESHPETPLRSIHIQRRLQETKLFDRLTILPEYMFVKDDPEPLAHLVHPIEHINNVKRLCTNNHEEECSQYDSIYYNGKLSYQAALDSLRVAVSMADAVANGHFTNGFANIRPPGHHATHTVPNGYCFFNNIAITAEYLLKNKLAKKILIVDIDVHHGQGTQEIFYERSDVLYFSIHRYEHGTFWPNLKESNYTYVGRAKGKGYNINVPLNEIGLTDLDYLTILHNVLLPIAYEYNPDIVLVSAGYDACVGCPEGRMNISPAFYGHLVSSLSGLADGRVVCILEGNFTYCGKAQGKGFNINVPLNEIGLADSDYLAIIHNILLPVAYLYNPDIVLVSAGYDSCVGCPKGEMHVSPAFYGHLVSLLGGLAGGKVVCLLEGGYFIPSLANAACNTIKGLLGDPCNPTQKSLHVNPSVIDSINNVKKILIPYWNCFQLEPEISIDNPLNFDRYKQHIAVERYEGKPDWPPYPTRGSCTLLSKIEEQYANVKMQMMEVHYNYNSSTKIGYAYSDVFTKHKPPKNFKAQETPSRIVELVKKFKEFNLFDKMVVIPIRDMDFKSHLEATHEKKYILEVLYGKVQEKLDLYMDVDSAEVCEQAILALLNLGRAVHKKEISGGVGLIRPPGHHAKKNGGGGFCLFNNVAILSNYLTSELQYQKVLIIDFDIHHGDGTQDITYDRKDVMYISMHRFDKGKFFPNDSKSNYNYIGQDHSAGYNVNIPFNQPKMGNADYIFTWFKLVLPLVYSYAPEIVIISAGFDAGVNDPLGHYDISPETFAHLVQTVKSVAPVILALEGGYNYETTALSMALCTKALLGDPIPMPKLGKVSPETSVTISNVVQVLKPYWPCLEVNKALNNTIYKQTDLDNLRVDLEKLNVELDRHS